MYAGAEMAVQPVGEMAYMIGGDILAHGAWLARRALHLLDQIIEGAYRKILRGGGLSHLDLLLGDGEAVQELGVSGAELAFSQQGLDGFGQFADAQGVGHGATRAADTIGHLLVRQRKAIE